MRSSLKLVAPVALLAAVVVAGCGGGDKRLSKADFTSKGNEICARYDKLSKAIADPSSLAEIPAYVDKAVPLFDKEVAEMSDLKPPKDLQKDFDAFIASGHDARRALLALEKAAKANDSAKVSKLSDAGSAQDKASDAIANRLGLTECAKS